MLFEFLIAERENILARCAMKLSHGGHSRSSNEELELGLPTFFDELVTVLRTDKEESSEAADLVTGRIHSESAKRCGQESLRLGYTVSQVVHGYGVLCQTITEHAKTHGGEPIKAREFNRLNLCLDVAIAEAVTEFSRGQHEQQAEEEMLRLGFLAHELRNALSNAATAHRLIKKGVVGVGGSTSQVLDDALVMMQRLIDRSLLEVRMQGEVAVERRQCRVIDLVGEVESTASIDAAAKCIDLHIDVSRELVIEADRHLVISALSNLVQNALKFTKENGNVWIRAKALDNRVIIEVEDQCGGLPPGKAEELFRPFTQKGEERKGVGLGLSIARRAVTLSDGHISVHDIPGSGCVFTIDLPRILAAASEGEDLSVAIH